MKFPQTFLILSKASLYCFECSRSLASASLRSLSRSSSARSAAKARSFDLWKRKSFNFSSWSSVRWSSFSSAAYCSASFSFLSCEMNKIVKFPAAWNMHKHWFFNCLRPGYFLMQLSDCMLETCMLLAGVSMSIGGSSKSHLGRSGDYNKNWFFVHFKAEKYQEKESTWKAVILDCASSRWSKAKMAISVMSAMVFLLAAILRCNLAIMSLKVARSWTWKVFLKNLCLICSHEACFGHSTPITRDTTC